MRQSTTIRFWHHNKTSRQVWRWLSQQENMKESVTMLIRFAIKHFGYRDLQRFGPQLFNSQLTNGSQSTKTVVKQVTPTLGNSLDAKLKNGQQGNAPHEQKHDKKPSVEQTPSQEPTNANDPDDVDDDQDSNISSGMQAFLGDYIKKNTKSNHDKK